MQDINGLQGHLLEPRLVVRSPSTPRLDSEVEGIGIHISIEPSGDVSLCKETERSLSVVERLELGVIVSNLVAVGGPSFELGDVAVPGSGQKVFGATTWQVINSAWIDRWGRTKEKINPLPWVPRVVAGHTVEVLLYDCGVLRALTLCRPVSS